MYDYVRLYLLANFKYRLNANLRGLSARLYSKSEISSGSCTAKPNICNNPNYYYLFLFNFLFTNRKSLGICRGLLYCYLFFNKTVFAKYRIFPFSKYFIRFSYPFLSFFIALYQKRANWHHAMYANNHSCYLSI